MSKKKSMLGHVWKMIQHGMVVFMEAQYTTVRTKGDWSEPWRLHDKMCHILYCVLFLSNMSDVYKSTIVILLCHMYIWLNYIIAFLWIAHCHGSISFSNIFSPTNHLLNCVTGYFKKCYLLSKLLFEILFIQAILQ